MDPREARRAAASAQYKALQEKKKASQNPSGGSSSNPAASSYSGGSSQSSSYAAASSYSGGSFGSSSLETDYGALGYGEAARGGREDFDLRRRPETGMTLFTDQFNRSQLAAAAELRGAQAEARGRPNAEARGTKYGAPPMPAQDALYDLNAYMEFLKGDSRTPDGYTYNDIMKMKPDEYNTVHFAKYAFPKFNLTQPQKHELVKTYGQKIKDLVYHFCECVGLEPDGKGGYFVCNTGLFANVYQRQVHVHYRTTRFFHWLESIGDTTALEQIRECIGKEFGQYPTAPNHEQAIRHWYSVG